MKDDDVHALLVEKLRWLRPPGMATTVPDLLKQAVRDNVTVADVLHRLCDEEKESRMLDAVNRRIKAAHFPAINTIDGFDFDFDPCRKKAKARYLALQDVAFIDKGINPLFIGKPGTGKTFLARALAYRTCQSARSVVLISAARMLNDLHGADLHGADLHGQTSSSSTTSPSSPWIPPKPSSLFR